MNISFGSFFDSRKANIPSFGGVYTSRPSGVMYKAFTHNGKTYFATNDEKGRHLAQLRETEGKSESVKTAKLKELAGQSSGAWKDKLAKA